MLMNETQAQHLDIFLRFFFFPIQQVLSISDRQRDFYTGARGELQQVNTSHVDGAS